MRLRIVRPLPDELEGVSVLHLRFGASYEVGPPLSDLLLVLGYGVPVDLEGSGSQRATADELPRRTAKRRTRR